MCHKSMTDIFILFYNLNGTFVYIKNFILKSLSCATNDYIRTNYFILLNKIKQHFSVFLT